MSESKALAKAEETALARVIDRDRMVREAAAAIANQTWGKGLSRAEQAAVARYALEAGLDPVRHVHVLGGTPYINADGYREKLAADPNFEGMEFENITNDAEARKQWGVPAFAKAAYLCTIYYKGRRPTTECGYAPKTEKKNSKGNYLDSIGMEFPHEKARTTATRRAAKNVVPIWSRRLEQLETQIQELHAQAYAIHAHVEEEAQPRVPMALPADPYADGAPGSIEREVVTAAEMARPVTVPEGDDPYGEDTDLFGDV